MTSDELKYMNFFYHPVDIKKKEPPLMEYVPIIDVIGEIMIYRRTEFGYNMRDAMADNSPCNNEQFVCWLEKVPLFEYEQQQSLIKLLEWGESNQSQKKQGSTIEDEGKDYSILEYKFSNNILKLKDDIIIEAMQLYAEQFQDNQQEHQAHEKQLYGEVVKALEEMVKFWRDVIKNEDIEIVSFDKTEQLFLNAETALSNLKQQSSIENKGKDIIKLFIDNLRKDSTLIYKFSKLCFNTSNGLLSENQFKEKLILLANTQVLP